MPTLRAVPVLSLALLIAVAFRVDAQCSPAVRKLEADHKLEEARAEMRALIKANDRDDAALHCMGRLAVDAGDPGQAVDWFERAIKVNDGSAAHHLWLGNALGEQAQHTSKLKLPFLARRIKSEFDRAVQLDPSSVDARVGLIQFYSQAPAVMGGSMDKAKEQARAIIALGAWRGHAEMGRLLERDKDLDGAGREFSAAASAAPDSAQAAVMLASFHRRQKSWDAAIAVYENFLKHRPDAVNMRLNIAATLLQSGTGVDRADREIRAWLAAPPADAPKANFATAHYLSGQVAERQGRKDAARAAYQQALGFDPSNANAKKALDALK